MNCPVCGKNIFVTKNGFVYRKKKKPLKIQKYICENFKEHNYIVFRGD